MRLDDLKYAVRRLTRAPGFTAVAVLTLALGIGANTAIFSLVNAVLIRDLPVRAPRELVEVYTSEAHGTPYSTSSYPDFTDLRGETDVFSGVVGSRTFLARMDGGERPRLAFGELVSWDYFQVLGVPMSLGRPFLEEEDATPGTHPVAILGYREWVTDYGRDPDILGRTLPVNGVTFTVVGVAPEAFTGTMPVLVTSLYVPLMMTNEMMGAIAAPGSDQLHRRGSRSMFLKARLRKNVTVDQANAALGALSASLAELYPESNENRVFYAVPSGKVAIHPYVDRMLKPVAALLLGVVGLVLLIACANLASFLLARAEDRRKEIAVRLALGASRRRLARQLLVETTLLALLGGVAGLLLADWLLKVLMGFQPPLPVPVDLDISLDRTVLLFTAGVTLATGGAFGLTPALQATNPDVALTLKDEAGAMRRSGRFTLRSALVVIQVAFSFVLLIGAGLFVRSLQKAQRIDPGFYTGSGAILWPMTELSGYGDGERSMRTFYRVARERLLASPEIDGVAMADRLPLGSGVQTGGYLLPGVPSDAPDGRHDIDNTTVAPGYFRTLDVPILAGRSFQDADVDGERVIVVSQALVDRFYPGKDLVGTTIEDGAGRPLRIIGVAADTKVRTLGEAPRPYVYQLQGQPGYIGVQIVLRGRGSSEAILEAGRRVLDEVDPNLAYFETKTMEEHLALLLFPPRMAALLLSVFGGLALLLSAIGVYGVVSHAVARRTRELGIRMSLGASAGDVVAMAVRGGMRLVLVGAVVGVLLAAGVTWSISGYLYGVGSTDLVTFAAIPAILSGVALVAAFVPARRAASVDPVRALKAE